MGSNEMKFLTYKPSKGRKQRCFVEGSSEGKQSQSLQLSFLGAWKFTTRGSWLCRPHTVVKQLHKILNSDDVHTMTKLKDLSQMHLGKFQYPRRVLFIKNPQRIYNPRKFYVLLENGRYCLQRTNWKKYFPPFRSAIEAYRDLHVLLGLFYNMYHDKYKDGMNQMKEDRKENLINFVVDQLVLIKVMKERKSDNSYSYEVRRGVIENTRLDLDTSQCIYTVYLLDFGFRLEVSDHFLCPLPRPFNCIAPLAMSCSLYGISPLGVKWCDEAILQFSALLESHADSVFVVDIMSNRWAANFQEPLKNSSLKPVILNINICNIEVMDNKGQKRRRRIKFEINLTQFMINLQMGSQWNLFPARPKLMGGVIPSLEDKKNHQNDHKKLPRTKISYQDALLMMNTHVPHLHMRLPNCVIRKELKKLFRLRHLSEILDMKNYLVVQTTDQDNRLKTPCSLKMLKLDEDQKKDQGVPVKEDQK